MIKNFHYTERQTGKGGGGGGVRARGMLHMDKKKKKMFYMLICSLFNVFKKIFVLPYKSKTVFFLSLSHTHTHTNLFFICYKRWSSIGYFRQYWLIWQQRWPKMLNVFSLYCYTSQTSNTQNITSFRQIIKSKENNIQNLASSYQSYFSNTNKTSLPLCNWIFEKYLYNIWWGVCIYDYI